MTKLNYQSRSELIGTMTGTAYVPQTRQQKIEAGKIWQIYPDVNGNDILFEGSETQCRKEIRRKYKKQNQAGTIRLAKLIWETEATGK